jgi:hypothetical protein
MRSGKSSFGRFLSGFLFLSLISLSLYAKALTPLLAISDIHFDPFYECHTQLGCPMIKKLALSPIEKWDLILSQYAGKQSPSSYGSDTNYPLFLSSLKALQKEVNKQHIKKAVLTGDLFGHEFDKKYMLYFLSRKDYVAFVNKTADYLFMKLKDALPSTIIFYAVGNNDSEEGDYVANIKGPFYNHLSKTLTTLLPKPYHNQFKKQFAYGGYYNFPLSKKLDLIVLNSTIFSIKRQGHHIKEGANAQYAWLKSNLENLKKQHKHAIIAMHIPLAINIYASLGGQSEYFFKEKEHKRLLSLLNPYHDTVIGIMTGHVHADTFFLFGNKNLKIMQTGIPSISPIFGTNPSFKVYQVDLKNSQIRNYQSYYFSPQLETAFWRKGYDFNQHYQPHCHHCTLSEGMSSLQYDTPLSDFYRRFYHSNSRDYIISKKEWRAYWCGIVTETTDAFANCKKLRALNYASQTKT